MLMRTSEKRLTIPDLYGRFSLPVIIHVRVCACHAALLKGYLLTYLLILLFNCLSRILTCTELKGHCFVLVSGYVC